MHGGKSRRGSLRCRIACCFDEAVSHTAVLQLFSKRPRPSPPASSEATSPASCPASEPGFLLRPPPSAASAGRIPAAPGRACLLEDSVPQHCFPSLTNFWKELPSLPPPSRSLSTQAPLAPEPVTPPNCLDQRPHRAVWPGGSHDSMCPWLSFHPTACCSSLPARAPARPHSELLGLIRLHSEPPPSLPVPSPDTLPGPGP